MAIIVDLFLYIYNDAGHIQIFKGFKSPFALVGGEGSVIICIFTAYGECFFFSLDQ